MRLKYNLSEVTVIDQFAFPESQESHFFPYAADMGGHYSCGSSYFTSRNYFRFSVLLYTVSGTGSILYRGREMSLPAERLILLDGKYAHTYRSSENQNWNFYWFHYKDRSPCSMADYLYEKGICIQKVPLDSFSEFYDKLRYFHKHNHLLSPMHICQIFLSYLTSWGTSNLTAHTPGFQTKESLVYRAQSLIDRNYAAPVTLDMLAKECSVSKYYIIRIFRDLLGITPHQYLLRVRIGHAKLLLLSTTDTIDSIGQQVGFSSSTSFLSAFRQIAGTTPASFRNSSSE